MLAPGGQEFLKIWITAVSSVSKLMTGTNLALNKHLLKKENKELHDISLKYHFQTPFPFLSYSTQAKSWFYFLKNNSGNPNYWHLQCLISIFAQQLDVQSNQMHMHP